MGRKKGKSRRRGSAPKMVANGKLELKEMMKRFADEGYPPPEERQKIIDRRFNLMRDIIQEILMEQVNDASRDPMAFINKHNPRDVIMVLNMIGPDADRPGLLTEESWIYRNYRRSYARWGGSQPFFNRREYEQQNQKYLSLLSRREMLPLKFQPGKAEKDLRNVLLIGPDLWMDIMPPDVPPRPEGFEAPDPENYSGLAAQLLIWGSEVDLHRLNREVSKNRRGWQAAAADLRRMALDEGLLAGWPGEPSSWAPEQAVELLRLMKLSDHPEEQVGLAAMADLPDDWLSDRLPLLWSAAGDAVLPALSEAFANPEFSLARRMVLLAGLQQMAEDHKKLRDPIVSRLEKLLESSPEEQATLNAYIIHVLVELEAEETAPTVQLLFDRGWVNPEIITPDAIDWVE